MLHILEHSIIDSLKLLPFLFATYVIIELIGHKSSERLVLGLRKYGVVAGALAGSFPQCGFSVAASNFYSSKVISVGTLIAVFISTSDEAIPVLLANTGSFRLIFKLIVTKIIIAIIAGLVADRFLSRLFNSEIINYDEHICEQHCHHCHDGILKSSIKHTLNIFVFIVIITFIMTVVIEGVGQENLSKILLNDSLLQPAIAALIGFIPNCASSIILTQLYVSGSLSFGATIAGLSTGAGIGLVVLFKNNKNLNTNIKIVFYIYLVSVLAGGLIQILM